MRLDDSMAFTRREFLRVGLTLASAATTVPWFLNASALGLPLPAPGTASIPGVPEDHILVVVQLSGGNDGLNTVVPFGFDQYYRARPGIAIPRNAALTIDTRQGLGLHPQMTALKEMFDEGLCTIVQGVGYPNPNRSHFKSMDIWHTADTSATGDGWLGRYFDAECCGYGRGESGQPEANAHPSGQRSHRPATPTPSRSATNQTNTSSAGPRIGQPGIAIGRTAPLAMQGRLVRPVAFETPDLFRWVGQEVDESLGRAYQQLQSRAPDAAAGNSSAAFLLRTAMDARISSDLIRRAVSQRPLATYPPGPLAQQLAMVASMIRAGLPTRVYYVQLGGFDTHAGQGGAQGRHAQLLAQFATAVRAFYADLKAQGNDARVLTMSFSEFGRRVAQNASQGTDHGTAAPMFLFGPMVRPGLANDHPSLSDLDEGDLRFTVDFRCVYAAVLEHWLGADSRRILNGSFQPAPVIRTRRT